MSKLVKKESEISQPPAIKLGVRDTDFLLRLIKKSSFDGGEVEQAYLVIQKLTEMHRVNLEN